MSKILITGHRGWIGTNFTKILDENNVQWIGIDKKDGNDLLHSFRHFYEHIQECDIVVHLAATARIPPSWDRASYYVQNNVAVTQQVAEACAKFNKYLIFASSSSVYGNGNGPLNPYSWTKQAGEQCIKMYGQTKDLNYTIARLFTNYGEDDHSGLVIGKWLELVKQGKPISVRGSGEQCRDFIHVTDTAAALKAICDRKPTQHILDIGTGISTSLNDIAHVLGAEKQYEAELDGYAVITKANLYHTQKHINWWPKVELRSWLNAQLLK